MLLTQSLLTAACWVEKKAFPICARAIKSMKDGWFSICGILFTHNLYRKHSCWSGCVFFFFFFLERAYVQSCASAVRSVSENILFKEEKNSYSCIVPCHLHPIYLDVSLWVFQAGNGSWEIPPHSGGPRRTRFNGRGRGSKVPPGSTFATLPRSCPGRRQSGQSAAL